MFDLEKIVRENIKNLVAYSSARDEFRGDARIFLDANENSFGTPLITKQYNRYPDPQQLSLKNKISQVKKLPVENIFVGNGSDEAIDILYRAFCYPGKDNVVIPSPTYGMYEISSQINDIEIRSVPLTDSFQLDRDAIFENITDRKETSEGISKLIFLCSPNNPTGNSFKRDEIKQILQRFNGLVVIDEAYIDFSTQESFISELKNYPNLVILQTLSKAWGLAALRVGMAFASPEIIGIFNKVKPPYNINQASQELALLALDNAPQVELWIRAIITERKKLEREFSRLSYVKTIYPSDANFILVKVVDPIGTYKYLVNRGIIVRDRSKLHLCQGCLRITVGTEKENAELISVLQEFN